MLTRSAIRAFSTEGLKVTNDVAKQQFVVKVKKDEAVLAYTESGNKITFSNTNVPDVFQGKGVGKLLAKYAFDYAAEKKLNVICECDFLAHYYEKNKNKYKNLNIKFDFHEERK